MKKCLNGCPCMDVDVGLIDETDYYGIDFSGKQRVLSLFFTGQSNYFPGIWIGNEKELKNYTNIDEYPVYIFDLSNDKNFLEPIGNFRNYIELIVQNVSSKDYEEISDSILKDLQKFSTKTINKRNYF